MSWRRYSGIVRVFWWLTTWREGRLLLVFTMLNWPETSVGYQGETTRKVESRCAASSRQCTFPHLCRGNGFSSRMRLRIAQSTAVFTRPGSVWLPRVLIFERFASWTELWLWRRGHPAINDWFELQDKQFFVDGVNSLTHRWEERVVLEGDYIEKL